MAHQGDVFDASFAAVPHVVCAAETNPAHVGSVYFQFPAWVEICRKKQGVEVPDELAGAYFDALEGLPSLVAAASTREWDADFLRCELSAIAAAKGQPIVAEAVQEMARSKATMKPQLAVQLLTGQDHRLLFSVGECCAIRRIGAGRCKPFNGGRRPTPDQI